MEFGNHLGIEVSTLLLNSAIYIESNPNTAPRFFTAVCGRVWGWGVSKVVLNRNRVKQWISVYRLSWNTCGPVAWGGCLISGVDSLILTYTLCMYLVCMYVYIYIYACVCVCVCVYVVIVKRNAAHWIFAKLRSSNLGLRTVKVCVV